MIVRQLKLIATAFTFLTRFPLVARISLYEQEDLGAAARWYPLVGIVIGALGAGVLYGSGYIFSREVAAAIALTCLVLATGAFHEDGLADTADGFGGAFDPARKLEIMKDSRIGTYGSAALILSLLIRWRLLMEIPIELMFVTLISAHSLSRWSAVVMVKMLPYVREGASNKPIAMGIGWKELFIATLTVGAVSYPMWKAHVAAILLTVLVVSVMTIISRRQIAGVTGDVLGATNQIVEIATLALWIAGVRAGLWWKLPTIPEGHPFEGVHIPPWLLQ